MSENKSESELKFEAEFIDYLTTIGGTKQWRYEPQIKTTEALWVNFKQILEQHNQASLGHPLSVVEFNQVKKAITELTTPYKAGQFLYGLNGVSQIEVDLDDGRHVYLTVFDQKQVGAGNTVYQVVNQIVRPAVISGKRNRQFDTTLLINGLPIIQIEEKMGVHVVREALNQMKEYIDERQYSDIFSTLQILIALSPHNVRYMANTTAEKFNTDFAFHWQRQDDAAVVRDWSEFANSMLNIPMAHKMATNYMILDGTRNKNMLKVMRPYQVQATQKVLDSLKKIDFESGMNKAGYVWHTTGSGKTITSFKTAWLASRMPTVDKVVFVVDRIALTNQTRDSYQAYDPDGVVGDDYDGNVSETRSATDLGRQLKSKGNNIIVTSVQKLATLVSRKNFMSPEKHIVFVVDEAHRSTGGDSFKDIQKKFKYAVWIGYTGTPLFDEGGMRTEDIFGKLLHAYTIREAIADKNVLGFKVDFEHSIGEDEVPEILRIDHPDWTDEQIEIKAASMTEEDIDDSIPSVFYDMNQEHVKAVVQDIFDKWSNRSNNGKYNALLTTHVGGGRASTPMAMMYFHEFQRVNAEHEKEGKLVLKVAVSFRQDTSHGDTELETNKGLFEAITAYNKQFGTTFGMDESAGYTQNVIERLQKNTADGNYLDLVIVVDQFLTGFDAPELNTLYVDRTLRGANLIQAYSRTNRVFDMQEKPNGIIVNYRWPTINETLMNNALTLYANRDSAKLTEEEQQEKNREDGILAQPYGVVFEEVHGLVDTLRQLSDGFDQIPPSEKKQEAMLALMRKYNEGLAKLKQYNPNELDTARGEVGFDYENPDELIKALGMSPEEELKLTTVLKNELLQSIAKKKDIPVYQLELKMTHVKDIIIDYDYLTELIENLLNQIHYHADADVRETKSQIEEFASGLDDRSLITTIRRAVEAIASGAYTHPPYPVKLTESETVLHEASSMTLGRTLLDFRISWGITDLLSDSDMKAMLERHSYGLHDLDDAGEITNLIAQASLTYQELAHNIEVQQLSRIKYRNGLKSAIYEILDELTRD